MEIAQTALRAQEDRDAALRQRDEARAALADVCTQVEAAEHTSMWMEVKAAVRRARVVLGRLDDAAPGAARPPEEGA